MGMNPDFPQINNEEAPGLESEQGCMQALYRAKWPEGFICPACGYRSAYMITTRRLPLFECKACRSQTSLIAGTIMEGSRTTLRRWFLAIQYVSMHETVNAKQLAAMIGVTYKTGWLIYHKIREAMQAAEHNEVLSGPVRVTDLLLRTTPEQLEGVFHSQEQLVFIGVTDNEHGEPVRMKLERQPKELQHFRLSSPSPVQFLLRHVDLGAVADSVVIPRYPTGPDRVQLRKLRQDLYLIGSEISHWMSWRFGGIQAKHFQRYLHQFSYRWNRASEPMFTGLVQLCATTLVITYPMLTRSAPRPLRSRSARATAAPLAA